MQGCEESQTGRRSRVVLVDDDPMYLAAVGRSLSKHAARIELVLLATSELALDYVPGNAVNLTMLDMYMPGLDGVEACRRLRACRVASPLAVVSCTMTCDLERAALAAGATYTREKPFDVLALIDLVASAESADADLRKQLITDHVDVAHNIARRLAPRYASILAPEDVVGAAMVGLCEAADRFDRSRSEPFLAFAEQRIRGAVLDQIRTLTSYGRVIYKRQRMISTARRSLTQNGDAPTDDRVAEHLGLTITSIQKTGQRSTRATVDVAALPSPVESPEARVQQAQLLALVARARAVLPEPEATVIALRYDRGMSLAQIAHTLELTPARVTHLHTTGVAQLKDHLRDATTD